MPNHKYQIFHKKIKATKREGLNALELSSTLMPMPFDETDLVRASSSISFRVTQNGKQYKLSCKIKVAEKKSPFSKLTVGPKIMHLILMDICMLTKNQ